MIGLGILIAIAEIIIGIIALISSAGQSVLIGAGIGYILSGFLFMWLCVGTSTAFSNSKRVDDLEKRLKRLTADKVQLENLLVSKGVFLEDEIQSKNNVDLSIKEMYPGFPLLTLKEKSIRNGSIVIPAKTRVFFSEIDNSNPSETIVLAEYEYNGEKLLLRYNEKDLANAFSYKEDEVK